MNERRERWESKGREEEKTSTDLSTSRFLGHSRHANKAEK